LDIQRQLCVALDDKANVNDSNQQETWQESFDPVYLDEMKQTAPANLNESTYTNVSEIFLLTTDTTLNNQTSLFSASEYIDELQHSVNNLMAKCGILEISTTVNDCEITQLKDDMSILKEKMTKARDETDKLVDEINQFFTSELTWINTNNQIQRENLLEDFQDFESLKEVPSTLVNPLNDAYCHLEPKHIKSNQRLSLNTHSEQKNHTYVESLVNDYEQKLNSLMNEKEQLADVIAELQSRRQLALTEKESVLNELQEYLAEIQELRSKLAKMENDNKQLGLDYEQKYENNFNNLKQTHEKQIAENIQANQQELETVAQSYQLKLESLTNDYEAKLLELIQKKDQVCCEILKIQGHLAEALNENQSLIIEIENLKNELVTLKSQVERENYSNLEKSSRRLAEENFYNVQKLNTN
jgi:chromosome segregation ATPase